MHALSQAGLSPEVLDPTALENWMSASGLGDGPITDAQTISGGTQNILVRFRRADREYILRRPPQHLRATSNAALLREMSILEALNDTAVPVPSMIAACRDETVLGGGVFYLMEPVTGFNAHQELPRLHAGDPAIRHSMGLEAVRGLAALAAVDYRAAGLAEFDRAGDFPKRQVPRWFRELNAYSGMPGYPGVDIPHLHKVGIWLDENRPVTWQPGIMHGDYHLANLMFSTQGSRLAAIVDWEMWTIGDPLLDLGWLLATWPSRSGASVVGQALADAGDIATADELAQEYALLTGADLSNLNWYVVLACFKLGILLEGTHARACAGRADADVGQTMHSRAIDLFDFAARTMEGIS